MPFNGQWFTVNDIILFVIWCLSYFDIKENAIDQMDAAQIKKFALDLQKQTDTVNYILYWTSSWKYLVLGVSKNSELNSGLNTF